MTNQGAGEEAGGQWHYAVVLRACSQIVLGQSVAEETFVNYFTGTPGRQLVSPVVSFWCRLFFVCAWGFGVFGVLAWVFWND